jgi:spore coat polysaccharide biosynthesis predicted glycosyltransferase SpsG/ribosomal protein S18 acetylase RimI-like enzyme
LGDNPVAVKKKIIFRCDGGSIQEIGLGHVVRCLLLARELQQDPGTEILFLMRDTPEAVRRVQQAGFPVKAIAENDDDSAVTLRTLVEFNPDIIVVDHLQNEPSYLSLIKKTGIILVTIDDWGEARKFADITINPIFRTGDSLYEGYDYMVLPPVPDDEVAHLNAGAVKNVFVSFGGFDASNITERFLSTIQPGQDAPQYHVVVSHLYENFQRLCERFASRNDIHLYQDPPNYLKLLHQADIAVVSGGLTMFHAAASGVPALVISQYDHQADNALRLREHRAVEYLGRADQLDFNQLMADLKRIKENEPKRREMAAMGRIAIDGLGIKRVVDVIGIVNRLDWDTAFFGRNIACLYPRRIRENILRFALAKCREDNIECLYYLCDCHDPESVRLVEKYRFHFVDVRLTYGLDLRTCPWKGQENGRFPFTIRPGLPADASALIKITGNTYIHSRYYFDRHFPADTCQRFYTDWIAKSLREDSRDTVFVAEAKGEIAGYVSCARVSRNCAQIGLLGIAEKYHDQEAGPALLRKCWEWCEANDLPLVEAVTQGRNMAAQRLFQSCGFRSKKTELWYHKWFGEAYDL